MVNLLLLVRSVFFEAMDESVLLEAMLLAFALPVLPVAAILISVLVPCRCACLQFSSLLILSACEMRCFDLGGYEWRIVHTRSDLRG